ncbi:uncharacterized protein ASCRUDRAFT_76152 [Ascoidea rubescens DSM 1968]|uniref:Uncharacterized protein n=1 Tax=Ascoidea rubescens DSM 1968 TaxID=1344418 RepID=A0A1D2VGR6_9ASCO|nr:hypothetical protein ASCRUDRAFT_76152 [Ascoidea rubescens DSM 1968]ODV60789.1 hypothetical protein ASCRUDRAFT_76152 [Ascoidea rubescens DSM 1968]
MSKLLNLLSNSLNNSKLDSKLKFIVFGSPSSHNHASSSSSSSPSITKISQLNEISLYTFDSSNLLIINNFIIKHLQLVNKKIEKFLLNKLKFFKIINLYNLILLFNFLLQCSSNDFLSFWSKNNWLFHHLKFVILNTNYIIQKNDIFTVDNINNINNTKNNKNNAIIKKIGVNDTLLLKILRYSSNFITLLSDSNQLNNFRLNFQKLRSEFNKPNIRSSFDLKRKLNHSSSSDNDSDDDDYNNNNYSKAKESSNHNKNFSSSSPASRSSKSLDINRAISNPYSNNPFASPNHNLSTLHELPNESTIDLIDLTTNQADVLRSKTLPYKFSSRNNNHRYNLSINSSPLKPSTIDSNPYAFNSINHQKLLI